MTINILDLPSTIVCLYHLSFVVCPAVICHLSSTCTAVYHPPSAICYLPPKRPTDAPACLSKQIGILDWPHINRGGVWPLTPTKISDSGWTPLSIALEKFGEKRKWEESRFSPFCSNAKGRRSCRSAICHLS